MKRVQVIYPLLHTRSINKQFPLLPYGSAHSYCSTTSFLDESEEEGVVQLLSKEEEEVEVMCKAGWMTGGFPAQPEEEAKGLLDRGKFVPLSPILPSSLYLPVDTESSPTISAFYS